MDLSISQMMDMQKALFALHENQWSPMEPEYGRDFILYMVEEIGEAIAILKKKGCDAVLSDADVRSAFLEEMADVLMYYQEVLLRFHVTPDEISRAYEAKHLPAAAMRPPSGWAAVPAAAPSIPWRNILKNLWLWERQSPLPWARAGNLSASGRSPVMGKSGSPQVWGSWTGSWAAARWPGHWFW